MKTAFDISSRFSIRPELAKDYARFALKLALAEGRRLNMKAPASVSFKVRSSPSDTRTGRASLNIYRVRNGETVAANYNPRVYVKVGAKHATKGLILNRYARYRHRDDCPETVIDGPHEAYVRLVAHELGHAVCGFEGNMTGEYHCERFAARVLDAWRTEYRDPAAMI